MIMLKRVGTGETFFLPENKNVFEIGRSLACDFVFKSKFVSRKHCEIIRLLPHGKLVIKQKTATNVTYLNNDVRLKQDQTFELSTEDQPFELCIGSHIGLGVPLSCIEKFKENPDFVYLKVTSSTSNNDLGETLKFDLNALIKQEPTTSNQNMKPYEKFISENEEGKHSSLPNIKKEKENNQQCSASLSNKRPIENIECPNKKFKPNDHFKENCSVSPLNKIPFVPFHRLKSFCREWTTSRKSCFVKIKKISDDAVHACTHQKNSTNYENLDDISDNVVILETDKSQQEDQRERNEKLEQNSHAIVKKKPVDHIPSVSEVNARLSTCPPINIPHSSNIFSNSRSRTSDESNTKPNLQNRKNCKYTSPVQVKTEPSSSDTLKIITSSTFGVKEETSSLSAVKKEPFSAPLNNDEVILISDSDSDKESVVCLSEDDAQNNRLSKKTDYKSIYDGFSRLSEYDAQNNRLSKKTDYKTIYDKFNRLSEPSCFIKLTKLTDRELFHYAKPTKETSSISNVNTVDNSIVHPSVEINGPNLETVIENQQIPADNIVIKTEPLSQSSNSPKLKPIIKKESLDYDSIKFPPITDFKVEIKQEPRCDYDDKYDDDNDIIIYSQINEVITLSSDEEMDDEALEDRGEHESSLNQSSSPELNLDTLFVMSIKATTTSEDTNDKVVDEALKKPIPSTSSYRRSSFFIDDDDEEDNEVFNFFSPQSTVKESDNAVSKSSAKDQIDKRDDAKGTDDVPLDNYWPQLSQNFYTKGAGSKSSPKPEESKIADVPLNSFWPVLSQDFDADSVETQPESHKGSSGKDLQSVIEKVNNNRQSSSSKCIEPLAPTRSRWKSRDTSATQKSKKEMKKIPISKNEPCKGKSKDSSTLPLMKKKSKSTLRNDLLNKHDLHSYKKTLEDISRKKHHAIEKPIKEAPAQSLLVKNVSIKPKDKRHSIKKGIAKTTHKSRSEKLTETDCFSSSTFKIPKTKKTKVHKQLSKQSDISPISSPADTPTVSLLQGKHDNKPVSCPSLHKEPVKKLSESAKASVNKRVHFPESDIDLVSIMIIPAREKCDSNIGPPVKYKESHIKSHPYEFIHHVCRWNYDWLLTYKKACKSGKKRRQPPPVGLDGCTFPILTFYSNFYDYKNIFSNLLFYEVWEELYINWNINLSSNKPCIFMLDTLREHVIKDSLFSLKFTLIQVFSYISRNDLHNCPSSGSFVSLRLEGVKSGCIFGYVENHTIQKKPKSIPSNLKAASSKDANTLLFLNIILSREKGVEFLRTSELLSISNIFYIRPSLRLFESLCNLPSLKMCPHILHPRDLTIFYPYENSLHIADAIKLNSVQNNAVCAISDKCCNMLSEPKISLIHGPPGSGKTRTIAALVAQINKLLKMKYKEEKCTNRRILVCAPSNAAVDELTLRLLKLKFDGIHLNVVRFGQFQSMRNSVKQCSFTKMLDKLLEKRYAAHANHSLEEDLKYKKLCLNRAIKELEKEVSPEKQKKLETRVVELARAQKELKERSKNKLTPAEQNKIYEMCKKEVLLKAEVITTTLTSCLSGALYEIFSNKKNSFACCIVDEAGQCKETDIWLPLQLGFEKLVLVGDHQQLPPTVLSNLAQNQNLHQSLFERLYHHIVYERNEVDLVHTLTIQYRMHEEIAKFPSQTYYRGQLITPAEVSTKRAFTLKPYLVFDLTDSKEETSSLKSMSNMVEVQFIYGLIESLHTHLQSKSIAILTPYKQQKIYLQEKLSIFTTKTKPLTITISTVDQFQGQEGDIVICSFVRANSKGSIGFVNNHHRLNVALTRAKESCFVIGNLSSLTSNRDWRALEEDAKNRKVLFKINSLSGIDKRKYLEMVLINSG